MDGVEGKSLAVLLERVDDAVACSLQHDEQEQSARYGKACGEGAEEVASQRSDDF